MARTTRSLADGHTTVVGYNVYLRGPGHMHFNNDVPLAVALVGLATVEAKHKPVVVRVTTEVMGDDARQLSDMASEAS